MLNVAKSDLGNCQFVSTGNIAAPLLQLALSLEGQGAAAASAQEGITATLVQPRIRAG